MHFDIGLRLSIINDNCSSFFLGVVIHNNYQQQLSMINDDFSLELKKQLSINYQMRQIKERSQLSLSQHIYMRDIW